MKPVLVAILTIVAFLFLPLAHAQEQAPPAPIRLGIA